MRNLLCRLFGRRRRPYRVVEPRPPAVVVYRGWACPRCGRREGLVEVYGTDAGAVEAARLRVVSELEQWEAKTGGHYERMVG